MVYGASLLMKLGEIPHRFESCNLRVDEYSFWEEYWEEEERYWKEQTKIEKELERQSQQIAYEADQRRRHPIGLRPPLHVSDLKKRVNIGDA